MLNYQEFMEKHMEEIDSRDKVKPNKQDNDPDEIPPTPYPTPVSETSPTNGYNMPEGVRNDSEDRVDMNAYLHNLKNEEQSEPEPEPTNKYEPIKIPELEPRPLKKDANQKREDIESELDEPVPVKKKEKAKSEVESNTQHEKVPIQEEVMSQTPPAPLDVIVEKIMSFEGVVKDMKKEVQHLKSINNEKNEQIEALTRGYTDLFLIDMQTLAEDINEAKENLLNVGTERQHEQLRVEENKHGPLMAKKLLERFFEDARTTNRETIPILNDILIIMNKFNEKLKYTEDS